MGTLRSAFDELRVQDLRDADDDELESDLIELERVTGVLDVERSRRILEFEKRQAFRRDGHLSVAAWLAERLRLSWSSAMGQVRQARSLDRMPQTRAALAEGEVSRSAVGMLATARDTDPYAFARAEAGLVEAARSMPMNELKGTLAYWRQLAEPERFEREHERMVERRRLHVSATLEGMVRVDGDLDPETGQTFMTALRSIQDADTRSGPDLRNPAQRRADALGELSRRWLDGSERPVVAGERPHVTVTMDLDALEGRVGRRCQLDDAGRVSQEDARRIACDATVARVITSARSEPLDVGRRTSVVPAPLRRAVTIRDGGCRFPGCDRPPGWCDAHHVRHWADGGATALDNLVLLCRAHHRIVHKGFGLSMVAGRPVFARPDGSVLQDHGPP